MSHRIFSLSGKEGTKAYVRVKRGGDGELKDFVAVRRPLRIQAINSRRQVVKNKAIGAISIRSFSSTTADDLANAIVALEE